MFLESNYSFLQEDFPQWRTWGDRLEDEIFTDPYRSWALAKRLADELLSQICIKEVVEPELSDSRRIDTLRERQILREEEAVLFSKMSNPDSSVLPTEALAHQAAGILREACFRFFLRYIDPQVQKTPYRVPFSAASGYRMADPDVAVSDPTEISAEVSLENSAVHETWGTAASLSPRFSAVTFPDGDRYEGEWRRGAKHGQGIYRWQDGTKYDGFWKEDVEHGRGDKNFANGDRYTGEWKEGMMDGQGRYQWSNGSFYEGEWKDNLEHGLGCKTLADGTIQTGEWSFGEWIPPRMQNKE